MIMAFFIVYFSKLFAHQSMTVAVPDPAANLRFGFQAAAERRGFAEVAVAASDSST